MEYVTRVTRKIVVRQKGIEFTRNLITKALCALVSLDFTLKNHQRHCSPLSKIMF